MTRGEDTELADVRAAAAGDLEAFERLYRAYHARVDRTARWLLASPDVGDVVQDVFVRAWRKLGQFDGRAAFGTWLHRLAVNVVLRARETRSRWHDRHPPVARGSAIDGRGGSAPAPGPVAATGAAAELRLALEAAVAALPDGAREVFVLFEVDGYSHAEIGEALGISAHTSRSQLHRARTLLRGQLGRGRP